MIISWYNDIEVEANCDITCVNAHFFVVALTCTCEMA